MESAKPVQPCVRWRWVSILPLTVIGAVALAAGGALYVAQHVHVHGESGDGISLDLPGGHVSIRANDRLDPRSLGVPVYPGARRTKGNGGGAMFSWNSTDGLRQKNLAVAGAELFTHDSVEKVVAFYRDQLPNWMIVTDGSGATRLELKSGGVKRLIVIEAESNGARIGVATAGEPASN